LQQSGTEKDLPGWNAIATLTGGMFNTIKISDEPRSYSIAGIENDFLSLNKKFSSTFVYYGSDGLKRFKMMNELDTFCMRISPKCFYSRCKIKTTANYLNKYAAWDLVTLFKANPPDFNSLNKKLLPDSLQQMDVPTLNKIVFAKKEEREYIVAQMRNSFSSLKPPQSNTSIVDSIFFEGLKK
jgi:hypothetical protein